MHSVYCLCHALAASTSNLKEACTFSDVVLGEGSTLATDDDLVTQLHQMHNLGQALMEDALRCACVGKRE